MAPCTNGPVELVVDVAVVGGGVVGVLAGLRLLRKGIDFAIFERQADFGGVWVTHGNNHSTLQAPEVAYRTHPRYPLGRRGPLEQVRGNAVLSTLRRLATEQGVRSRTRFGCEVETVRSGVKDDRYELHVRDLATAAVTTVRANFILACHGVHGRQLTPADRGLPVSARFRGTVTLGGRAGGTDSAVGSSCVNGKDVVVLDGGAFACEAMREAVRNGARSVVMVTRQRTKWVLPFSRQFAATAVSLAPLAPWAWKMAALRWWLARSFYRPCGLAHLVPDCAPADMVFTGQAHDSYFSCARDGTVQHLLGAAAEVDDTGVRLADGRCLPADVVVFCGGCAWQGEPAFLAGLGLGLKDLHSWAFLGDSGRIATASDGVFRYTPAGPNRQLDMLLRAHELFHCGRLQELRTALEPTPLAGEDTLKRLFEVSSPLALQSALTERRNRAYINAMTAGMPRARACLLRARLVAADWGLWLSVLILAVLEKLAKWRV